MDSTLVALNSSRAMAFVSLADLSPFIRQGRGTLQSTFGNYGVSARPVVRLRLSNRQRFTSVRATADAATTTPGSMKPAILLTENALKHLNKMKVERKEDLCLRIGVRQGGCSGMSYVMDFEQRANLRPDDSIIDYDGFTIACDPKSLLFLYGMQLDFSDALIGGGFSFKNPNATSTCGCGKSFAA